MFLVCRFPNHCKFCAKRLIFRPHVNIYSWKKDMGKQGQVFNDAIQRIRDSPALAVAGKYLDVYTAVVEFKIRDLWLRNQARVSASMSLSIQRIELESHQSDQERAVVDDAGTGMTLSFDEFDMEMFDVDDDLCTFTWQSWDNPDEPSL